MNRRMMLDIYGLQVEPDLYMGRPRRTKAEYPYSYDPFTTWGMRDSAHDGADYSDRLFQWDPKKYDELCKKHWGDTGQYFSSREPNKVEAFLRDYHNIPDLQLVEIQEGANHASGYPYWIFFYRYDKAAAEKRWAEAKERNAASTRGVQK